MPKVQMSSHNFIIGLTLFLLVMSLILTATHSSPKCFYSENGEDWKGCDNRLGLICSSPAIQLSANFNFEAENVDIELVCPWNVGVIALASISFVLSIAFIVMLGLQSKISSSRLSQVFLGLGISTTLMLAITMILMLIDMIHGHQSIESYTDQIQTEISANQFAYVFNMLLVLLSCDSVLCLTINGYQIWNKKVQSIESIVPLVRQETIFEQ